MTIATTARVLDRGEPVRVSLEVSEAEWDAFVDAHPDSSGCHLWRWRRVFERTFRHRTLYLAARSSEGEVVGVLPAVIIRSWLFGRFMVSLPFVNYGGVLAASDAVARALVDHAALLASAEHVTHLELRHSVRRFDDLPVKQHKVAMRMPLAADEARAWDRLDRKVRNQIKKAQKNDLTADVGGRELVDEFFDVFAQNMRDLGTPVHPRRFFHEVFEQFPSRARVVVVRQGARAVAAAIGYRYRDTFEIPWASSLRSHRALCPNNLLYWRAIQQATADGCTTFDFGRSTPDEGTFHFKKQWGAEPSPLFWEYRMLTGGPVPDQSPKNPKFRSAIAVWKRLPLPVATWLGPGIMRSIPG
jgi:FemAB-related protein (PEP-CTERM system-associated)